MKQKQHITISIVLGTYNRKNFLKLSIKNIRKEITLLDFPCEIIVIDGGSTDGTLRWLLRQKDIITIVQHNRGTCNGKPITRRSWGYFMNLGFKCARGKYICMLSDDCLLIPESLRNGHACFEKHIAKKKNIGALAFYWREWPRDTAYHIGITHGNNIFVNHGMYLTSALKKINYIDEDTYKFYCADGDLCLRLKQAGLETLACDTAYVEHYPHANLGVRVSNLSLVEHDQKAFNARWANNTAIASPPIPNNGIISFVDNTDTGSLFRTVAWKEPQIMWTTCKGFIRAHILRR